MGTTEMPKKPTKALSLSIYNVCFRHVEKFIIPMELKLFGALDQKNTTKHYLEKGVAWRSREVKNLIKPIENQLFQKSKTLSRNFIRT